MQGFLRLPGLTAAAVVAVTLGMSSAAQASTISFISPETGPTTGGTLVTITGAGFTGADAVDFTDLSRGDVVRGKDFRVVSDTQIQVRTPAVIYPGRRDVTIDDFDGGAYSQHFEASFEYTGPASGNLPVVTKLTPASGPSAGGNFVGVQSTFSDIGDISFLVDGVQVPRLLNATADPNYKAGDPMVYGFVAPAHAPGKVDVQVRSEVGLSSTGTSADDYTYSGPAGAAPVVTGVSRPVAKAGVASLTVNGTGLRPVTSVTVGGQPASFLVGRGESITVVTADLPRGVHDVRVTTGNGTSANTAADDVRFYDDSETPTISSIAPTSGPITGGTVVMVKGTNLDLVQEVSLYDANSFTVLTPTAVSSTELKLTTPATTATGARSLDFYAAGLVEGAKATFTYTDAISTPSAPPTATPTPSAPPTATPTPTPTASVPATPTPTAGVRYGYALAGSATLKTLTKGTLPLSGTVDAELKLSTGAFSATLGLNATQGNLTALGFLPVSAKVQLVPLVPATGTLTSAGLTASTQVRIKLPEIKALGIPLAGGANCQTKNPSQINLKSGADFDPLEGGTLNGTFSISDLSGCGFLTGLVSPITSGSGNAISLKLTGR
ncbi:MAG: IPT/TIG domain-containing protein [Patulibacter minatonensis]